jgi:hypothetical protein
MVGKCFQTAREAPISFSWDGMASKKYQAWRKSSPIPGHGDDLQGSMAFFLTRHPSMD